MLRRGKVATTSVASGKVEISHAAMAPSGLRGNLAYYLRQDDPRRGIVVEMEGERIVITLYVILEYGVRISEVAQNVMALVKFAVERALGMSVAAVNVYVQGLHFSE
jgi:uncharacterized alkaline shock family protein YloU